MGQFVWGPSSLPSVYPGWSRGGAGACLVLSVRAAYSLASELLAAVLPVRPCRGFLPGAVRPCRLFQSVGFGAAANPISRAGLE